MTTPLNATLSTLIAPPQTLSHLRALHSAAIAEPAYSSSDAQPASAALIRYVALDAVKCALVYLLVRGSGARRVVEAGTSFGVSTVWLALGAGQNVREARGQEDARGVVIATQNEAAKAARARENWRLAGEQKVQCRVELREGDLRDTLKTDLLEHVDFVLLEIWAQLELLALKLVHPRLKTCAMVVVDNVVPSADGYCDLLAYLNDAGNGFRCTTAPYSGGLLIAVYIGQ